VIAKTMDNDDGRHDVRHPDTGRFTRARRPRRWAAGGTVGSAFVAAGERWPRRAGRPRASGYCIGRVMAVWSIYSSLHEVCAPNTAMQAARLAPERLAPHSAKRTPEVNSGETGSHRPFGSLSDAAYPTVLKLPQASTTRLAAHLAPMMDRDIAGDFWSLSLRKNVVRQFRIHYAAQFRAVLWVHRKRGHSRQRIAAQFGQLLLHGERCSGHRAGRCPMVTDLCRAVPPTVDAKAVGYLVACHYAERRAAA
jgi:hypothetical protein